MFDDSSLLCHFEDLLALDDEVVAEANAEQHLNEEDSSSDKSENNYESSGPADASTLSLAELATELDRRGIHARGFFADDSKTLQAEYDKEYEESVESRRREQQKEQEEKAKHQALQMQKRLTEHCLRREQLALESDPRVRRWLELIAKRSAPRVVPRLVVDRDTARIVARALWTDSSLVGLDVSNLKLPDATGAYLCRLLQNNSTLVKLELDGNRLGPLTCKELEASLKTNDSLLYLSLESNPLTQSGDGDDLSGIQALSQMIRDNRSLTYLNLLRCNIEKAGANLIASTIESNDTLTTLEVGFNNWNNGIVSKIASKLRENQKMAKVRKNANATRKRIEREAALKVAKEEEQKTKKTEMLDWLEEQKLDRAENRRVDQENSALEKARIQQEQQQQEEMERIALEKQQAATKSKEKSGKKKGNKQKKKR